jgi:hypothetical protein
VTTNWTTAQTAIPAAIRAAADDPDLQVSWGELPEAGAWQNPINVMVRIRGLRAVGQAETVHRVETGRLRPVRRAPRLLDLQIQVETQDQNLAASALVLADQIHAALDLPDATSELTAAGLSRASQTQIRAVDYTDAHRRRRSAMVWELTLNVATEAVGALIDWMASVEYGGTVTDEVGDETTIGPTTVVLP